MRIVAAALTVATIFSGSAPAQAERRIFILPNNADGYGVDRCLVTGGRASCGCMRAGY